MAVENGFAGNLTSCSNEKKLVKAFTRQEKIEYQVVVSEKFLWRPLFIEEYDWCRSGSLCCDLKIFEPLKKENLFCIERIFLYLQTQTGWLRSSTE